MIAGLDSILNWFRILIDKYSTACLLIYVTDFGPLTHVEVNTLTEVWWHIYAIDIRVIITVMACRRFDDKPSSLENCIGMI